MRDLTRLIPRIDETFLNYTLRFPGEPDPEPPNEFGEFEPVDSIYDNEDGTTYDSSDLYGNAGGGYTSSMNVVELEQPKLSYNDLYGNAGSGLPGGSTTTTTTTYGTTTAVGNRNFGEAIGDLFKSPFLFVYDVIMDCRKRNKADFQLYTQKVFTVAIGGLVTSISLFFLLPGIELPLKQLFICSAILIVAARLLLLKYFNLTDAEVAAQAHTEKIEWDTATGESTGEDTTEELEEFYEDSEDIYEEDEEDYDDSEIFEDSEDTFEVDEDEESFDWAPTAHLKSSPQRNTGSDPWREPVNLPTTGGKLNLKVLSKATNQEFRDILVDSLLKTRRRSAGIDLHTMNPTRVQLLKSFSEFIYANTPKFSEWQDLGYRGSVVATNVCYLIYEALREEFKLTYLEDPFRIVSIKENELMYRVEAICSKKVRKEAENSGYSIGVQFRSDEKSTPIVQIRSMGTGKFIFKIMKPVRRIVSLGDIIEYQDPESGFDILQAVTRDDKHLPFIVGLVNNEVPSVIDLASQTHIAVVGESGGGKSWFIFYMFLCLLLTNKPSDVSFMIFDRKNSPIFHSIARFPHVIHLENDVNNYLPLFRKISEELAVRKKILEKFGCENWKTFRARFRDKPEILRNFPFLFIVVDELATTLESLKDLDEAKIQKPFIGLMAEVAREARSFGMRIVPIAQRTTADNIPKQVITQCGFKIGFNLTEVDYERMDIKKGSFTISGEPGQALVANKDVSQSTVLVRTLGTGAVGSGDDSDDQIIDLMKILSLEWTLRNPFLPPIEAFREVDSRLTRKEQLVQDFENENYFSGTNKTDEELAAEVLELQGVRSESAVGKQAAPVTPDKAVEIRYRDQEKVAMFTNNRYAKSASPAIAKRQEPIVVADDDDDVLDDEDIFEEESGDDHEDDGYDDGDIYDDDGDVYDDDDGDLFDSEEEFADDDLEDEESEFEETDPEEFEEEELEDDEFDSDHQSEHPEQTEEDESLIAIVSKSKPDSNNKYWAGSNLMRAKHTSNTIKANTTEVKQTNLSLIEYMKERGGKVEIVEIRSLFPEDKIRSALFNSDIVESGDGRHYLL